MYLYRAVKDTRMCYLMGFFGVAQKSFKISTILPASSFSDSFEMQKALEAVFILILCKCRSERQNLMGTKRKQSSVQGHQQNGKGIIPESSHRGHPTSITNVNKLISIVTFTTEELKCYREKFLTKGQRKVFMAEYTFQRACNFR